MRDPNRIDDVLEELEEYWKEHPDLRLAQIIVNIYQDTNHVPPGKSPDPYYMEDSVLFVALKERNEDSR